MLVLDPEAVVGVLLTAPRGLSAPQIAQRLRPRPSQPTLWRALDGLLTRGRVVREGSARATRYHARERWGVADLRSLRLHEAVASRLLRDASLVAAARARLAKLRAANPQGRRLHDRWAALLDGPQASLLRMLTEPSESAAQMRKESPFTPLVSANERRAIFAALRLG